MHLSLSEEMHTYNPEELERKRFSPIFEESALLNQEITTIFKATIDIESDISDIANQVEYDLLLIGLGKSIFEGTLLGKVLGFTTRIINPDRLIDKFTGKEGLFENSPFDERTRQIVSKSKMPLGILIDKELQEVKNVFVPIFTIDDAFLLDYGKKLIDNSNSIISILDNNNLATSNFIIESALSSLEQKHPDLIQLMPDPIMKKGFLNKQDLMIISLESWKKLVDSQSIWLTNVPSVLILKP